MFDIRTCLLIPKDLLILASFGACTFTPHHGVQNSTKQTLKIDGHLPEGFPECLPTKTDLSFTAVTKAVQHKCWSTVKFRSSESGKGEFDKMGVKVYGKGAQEYTMV